MRCSEPGVSVAVAMGATRGRRRWLGALIWLDMVKQAVTLLSESFHFPASRLRLF